jgi:dephospho-CoA kinase
MAKIIGLTGGMGSGKTTIASWFLAKGVPVYIADNQAREIMKSPDIISSIKQVFGKSIFDKEILNREKLANIVFDVPEKLKLLNEIIHPAVKKDFNQWVKNHKNSAFVVYESAILFESGSYKNCDLLINVIAPIETRVQRVIERDKTTREAVLKRMQWQWTDEQRSEKSDFNIENSDLESTKLEFEKTLKILNI